ncbi:hypothetical protein [Paracoccus sp. (in: a-proteobacteria)]|uniref:hypothetical protein n=1 Tax=Paracoccus sp. TaxID=267 RepID=UPI0026E06FD1|nr:hypothetical protein [Paracoccus sp. (in: a-proteobacteria)]MDO5370866.1 hypothetical protein [Paracoccus sp. (in: a-proteobacteria)]
MNAAAAEVIGLLVHDLVTDSLEHGSLGRDKGGELQVDWRIEPGAGGDLLRLDWIERGGPAMPAREGLGIMVLQGMLRYQLDGAAARAFSPGACRILWRCGCAA